MIKVVVEKNEIEVSGHANYDEYGKDIVCAAASATMLCTANAIISLDDKAIEVIQEKNKQTIKVLKEDKIVDTLIINMINCFESLTNDYPKNIKITKEEEK